MAYVDWNCLDTKQFIFTENQNNCPQCTKTSLDKKKNYLLLVVKQNLVMSVIFFSLTFELYFPLESFGAKNKKHLGERDRNGKRQR